ncbi:MAG: hypothetical protein JWO30_4669 [Fibrobacteres bacterium]|nr:hypothetical protein [Fibrobacterota bacterium]
MAARNLSVNRSSFVSIDPLRVDASKLKKAKRILGSDSDVDTLNKALAMVIANEEMESAIEKAFGAVPYFQVR